MARTNIILTGFMGTGKSTIGRKLARRLEMTFVDTDQLIEERAGCSIADIFARQSESAFRKMEEDLVEELAAQKGLVIATGGGLVMNPHNVKRLQASGRIFCLTATAQEVFKRVKKQIQVRPLLQQPDPLQRITELMQHRSSVYGQFPQISTSGRSPAMIVEELVALAR